MYENLIKSPEQIKTNTEDPKFTYSRLGGMGGHLKLLFQVKNLRQFCIANMTKPLHGSSFTIVSHYVR